MARVTQQRIRQMLLTTGDPLDPNELPERLQLFNELGEPLMLGSSGVRTTKEHTTGFLTPGTIETDVLEIAPSWRMFRIATNRPARVRVYPTAIYRDNDLNRALGTKPRGDHGRLFELVTSPNNLEYALTPLVDMVSDEPYSENFYISVTNLDITAGGIETTYHYIRTE